MTATSVTDPTKSASASILIQPAGPTLANGTYVFQMSGDVNFGDSFITGALVARDGAIVGGEQDSLYYGNTHAPINRIPSGIYPYDQFQPISGGSYASTPDGNLQITIQLGNGASEVLCGTLAAGGKGFISGFDGAPFSGTMDLETSTAAPQGGYVLSLRGENDWGTPASLGGVVNIDGAGAISGTGSLLDVYSGSDDVWGEVQLGASTVSAPDGYGRVVFQLQPGATSTMLPLYLAGYMVDATHIRLIETGDDSNSTNFQGVLCGTALGQGASTGNFKNASLAGSSYVFGVAGFDWNSWIQVAGVLTANADGTVNGTLNWNDQTGTSVQSPLQFTGTYTVDPTGRVTLSNLTDGATFTYAMHMYLTGNGEELIQYIPGTVFLQQYSFAGEAFQRQASALKSNAFSGAYGLFDVDDTQTMVEPQLGPASARGSVNVTASSGTNAVEGFVDNGNGALAYLVSGSLTYVSDGIFTGTLTGLNPASSVTSGNFTLYLVDDTQAVLVETDNSRLVLGRLVSLK